jgi:hypothetical protein
MSFAQRLRRLDAFKKFDQDLVRRTHTGACVSVVAVALALTLLSAQLSLFLTPERSSKLQVDDALDERLRIDFDVTFPALPCSVLSLDAMDESGEHRVALSRESVVRLRLDHSGKPFGGRLEHSVGGTVKDPEHLGPASSVDLAALGIDRSGIDRSGIDPGGAAGDGGEGSSAGATAAQPPCGSCYGAGAPGECCDTCDAVRRAYVRKGWTFSMHDSIPVCLGEAAERMGNDGRSREGCNFSGHVEVERAAGNLHFAPAQPFNAARLQVPDLMEAPLTRFDLSHRINRLTFSGVGDGAGPRGRAAARERQEETLRGQQRSQPTRSASGMFQYYIKVVPSTFVDAGGAERRTHQYSVTEHYRELAKTSAAFSANGVPGVYFFYDLSAVALRVEERRMSLPAFLTLVSAVVGGTFTVMGLLDRALERGVAHFSRGAKLLK